jgi:hypothetical protein
MTTNDWRQMRLLVIMAVLYVLGVIASLYLPD